LGLLPQLQRHLVIKMADLICGEGGSNGAEIIARINELTKLDPIASMRLATPISQTFADGAAPELMSCFDVVTNEIQGFLADATAKSLKNGGPHIFNTVEVSIGINLDFPGTEELEIYTYVNDVQYSAQPLSIHGLGTGKAVAGYWESTIILNPEDIVTLKAKNGAAGALTVNYKRSTFKITASWRETLQ